MPYLVVAPGKESEENDCPLVRLSVPVAADLRVNIEERRGSVEARHVCEVYRGNACRATVHAVTSAASQGPQKPIIMYAKCIGGMHAGRKCTMQKRLALARVHL